MRRLIRIAVTLIVLLLIAAAAVSAMMWREYRKCETVTAEAELLSPAPAPEKGVALASKFNCVFRVRTPWSYRFTGADITAGKGSQEAGTAAGTVEKRKWGKLLWSVSVPIQAYADGKIPEGKAVFHFLNGDGRELTLSAKLPGFTSIPGAPDGELKIANAMEIIPPAKQYRKWIIAAVIAILLIGFVTWLILRRKNGGASVHKILPWEQALNSISELRKLLSDGKETPETAVGRLTDVVRRYLENRFGFRAEHQTTREFLRELDQDNSPLDLEKRGFLRDFLCSADMVKFAKLPADRSLFEHAAGKAEELVRNTTIENTEKKQ